VVLGEKENKVLSWEPVGMGMTSCEWRECEDEVIAAHLYGECRWDVSDRCLLVGD